MLIDKLWHCPFNAALSRVLIVSWMVYICAVSFMSFEEVDNGAIKEDKCHAEIWDVKCICSSCAFIQGLPYRISILCRMSWLRYWRWLWDNAGNFWKKIMMLTNKYYKMRVIILLIFNAYECKYYQFLMKIVTSTLIILQLLR